MNFKSFLATIRLYWKTFVAVTLAVLALGLAWLWLTPLQYVSTAQLLVSIQGTSTANAYQNDDVVAGRVNSYVALITTDVVSQRVIDKLGLKLTPAQLSTKVSAVSVPNTSIINVAVTDSSRDEAHKIADTVATEFVAYTQALESPTGEDAQRVQTTVVSGASQPKSRLVERIALGGLVAALAALVGAVAVWIRSVTDPVIRTAAQAALATGVPVLGGVGCEPVKSLEDLDDYRRIRTRLADKHGAAVVIQISPVDDRIDGAVIANNLGRVLTMRDQRCAIVDATGAGSQTSSDRDMQPGEDGSPDIFPAPDWLIAPEQALNDGASYFSQFRADYDRVIVATSSALTSATVATLSDYVDTVLLVVATTRTTHKDATLAAARLNSTGAPLAGVLIAGLPRFSQPAVGQTA